LARDVVGGDGGHEHAGADEVDPVADLVQAEQLVLHGPVVELEESGPDQPARDEPPRPERPLPAQVGHQEQARDRGEPAERVEQPVRDEPDLRRRPVVEVVPVQELVEHGLVDEGDGAQAEQDAGNEGAAGSHRPAAVGCGHGASGRGPG
jgi:hypothetical protein